MVNGCQRQIIAAIQSSTIISFQVQLNMNYILLLFAVLMCLAAGQSSSSPVQHPYAENMRFGQTSVILRATSNEPLNNWQKFGLQIYTVSYSTPFLDDSKVQTFVYLNSFGLQVVSSEIAIYTFDAESDIATFRFSYWGLLFASSASMFKVGYIAVSQDILNQGYFYIGQIGQNHKIYAQPWMQLSSNNPYVGQIQLNNFKITDQFSHICMFSSIDIQDSSKKNYFDLSVKITEISGQLARFQVATKNIEYYYVFEIDFIVVFYSENYFNSQTTIVSSGTVNSHQSQKSVQLVNSKDKVVGLNSIHFQGDGYFKLSMQFQLINQQDLRSTDASTSFIFSYIQLPSFCSAQHSLYHPSSHKCYQQCPPNAVPNQAKICIDVSCDSGQYLDKIRHICQNCKIQCQSCHSYLSCIRCKEGYKNQLGICITMAIDTDSRTVNNMRNEWRGSEQTTIAIAIIGIMAIILIFTYHKIRTYIRYLVSQFTTNNNHIFLIGDSLATQIILNAEAAVCSICLCNSTDFMSHCLHYYHIECIKKWMSIQPNCPTCRMDLHTKPNYVFCIGCKRGRKCGEREMRSLNQPNKRLLCGSCRSLEQLSVTAQQLSK